MFCSVERGKAELPSASGVPMMMDCLEEVLEHCGSGSGSGIVIQQEHDSIATAAGGCGLA